KNIIVIYAITIKSANGFNEANPSWATVAPIKPATPNGAKCIIQPVILNITSATACKKVINILHFSSIAAIPKTNRDEKKITGSISAVANASKKLEGKIDISIEPKKL